MSADFLHGVETVQVKASGGNLKTVKTSVIGLIGTAENDVTNELILCTSETDDALFGDTGTIPTALKIIRQQYKSAIVFAISIATTGTTPTAADFEGEIDAITGVKTGLFLFEDCYSNFGFLPKIIIAPTYSATATIATLIRATALQFRAAAYIDAPLGMTIAAAKTSRGVSGVWNFSDYRAKLLFPGVVNSELGTLPLSPFAAGNRAAVDNNEGFWFSSSNHELQGVMGLETLITSAINDPDSDSNLLNAAGITTVFNTYGSGFREWGNRNSAFPTNTDPRTFESIQRLDDITSESIELAMLPFLDKPMNQAQIDLVSETVNSYFNNLISKGALLPGSKCYFDKTKNTVEEMAAGHFVWTKEFMGAVPGERLTFYSVIDTNLLSKLIS
jgi:uncharacterized protein